MSRTPPPMRPPGMSLPWPPVRGATAPGVDCPEGGFVGGAVGAAVGVFVDVPVGVAVDVPVGVAVDVPVGVAVEVAVGVSVGVVKQAPGPGSSPPIWTTTERPCASTNSSPT
jgi:hypothetical protein